VFFEHALARAGCPAQDCVMVGDSEANDIAPSHARGMVTIGVYIEEPRPATTVADHLCGSLSEVAQQLFTTLAAATDCERHPGATVS
jgi:FMN phosphatase YigB (HAD superfamily)